MKEPKLGERRTRMCIWEKLMHPPLPAELLQDLHRCSEKDGVAKRQLEKIPQPILTDPSLTEGGCALDTTSTKSRRAKAIEMNKKFIG